METRRPRVVRLLLILAISSLCAVFSPSQAFCSRISSFVRACPIVPPPLVGSQRSEPVPGSHEMQLPRYAPVPARVHTPAGRAREAWTETRDGWSAALSRPRPCPLRQRRQPAASRCARGFATLPLPHAHARALSHIRTAGTCQIDEGEGASKDEMIHRLVLAVRRRRLRAVLCCRLRRAPREKHLPRSHLLPQLVSSITSSLYKAQHSFSMFVTPDLHASPSRDRIQWQKRPNTEAKET